jgi:hypothetical protein
MQTIRRLCSFEGRYPGTDAERRAANDLAEQLRARGIRAEIEPTYVHPQWHLIYAAHLALGVAASLVSFASPPVGFALLLLTLASFYFELNTRFHFLRRFFFRRASQNVLARAGGGGATERVVLCAHYDANRTGVVFRERSRRLLTALTGKSAGSIGPMRIVFWAMALLVPMLGARLAGMDAAWLSLAQLVPTLALVVGAILLVDIALSDVVPGANDNASGVVVAMALMEALRSEAPANLETWVLLTGAEECGAEGIRGFLKAHRGELKSMPTRFVILDMVGQGIVHYETAEGLAVAQRMDPRLIQLCEAIADADRQNGNRFDARPLSPAFLTDAIAPAIAGYPTIALVGADENGLPPFGYHTPRDTPDRIEEAALERFHGFALELVRQIDRDAGRHVESAA